MNLSVLKSFSKLKVPSLIFRVPLNSELEPSSLRVSVPDLLIVPSPVKPFTVSVLTLFSKFKTASFAIAVEPPK